MKLLALSTMTLLLSCAGAEFDGGNSLPVHEVKKNGENLANLCESILFAERPAASSKETIAKFTMSAEKDIEAKYSYVLNGSSNNAVEGNSFTLDAQPGTHTLLVTASLQDGSKCNLAHTWKVELDSLQWLLAHDAVYDSNLDGGTYIITPTGNDKKGLLATSKKYRIEEFTVTFTVKMDLGGPLAPLVPGPAGADGISVGFTDQALTATTPVGHGGYLGFMGIGGYAVGFDTHENRELARDNLTRLFGDPSGNFVSMMKGGSATNVAPTLLRSVDTQADGLFFNDGNDHMVKVVFSKGKISVEVNNKKYIENYQIPNFVPYNGHIVITGATGASYNRQMIRNLVVHGIK